jgi:hypothetical protein
MYEIFTIVYGWELSAHPEIRALIEEDAFDDFGGRSPYSGSDEPTIYIGVDVYCVDCGDAGKRFDDWNKKVQSKLAKAKAKGLASNIKKWQQDIIAEVQTHLNSGYISQAVHDKFVAYIKTDPELFWAWSTS